MLQCGALLQRNEGSKPILGAAPISGMGGGVSRLHLAQKPYTQVRSRGGGQMEWPVSKLKRFRF